MANIVALLESMWGWRGYSAKGDVIRYFHINPDNLSGRRLYRIVGNHRLLVTNCCRECQATANDHGTPDPEWVRENLQFLEAQGMDLLLVCGRVAEKTFKSLNNFSLRRCGIVYMDHPAARNWTIAKLNEAYRVVQDAVASQEALSK